MRRRWDKPPGLGPEYATQFADQSVADAYHHRPPHAEEALEFLRNLIPSQSTHVLDLGCGTGDLARPLAQRGETVDAVDVSEAMISKGKSMPGGCESNLRWIHGAAEDVEVYPPYGLVIAGESLHWMDWVIVLPRLRGILHSDGYLALVDRQTRTPWGPDLFPIINRYSTNRDFQPYNLVDELSERCLFRSEGEYRTSPVSFYQHIDAYVESFHSRNGLSRDRMSPHHAADFDREVRELTSPWQEADLLELEILTRVVWGRPLNADS